MALAASSITKQGVQPHPRRKAMGYCMSPCLLRQVSLCAFFLPSNEHIVSRGSQIITQEKLTPKQDGQTQSQARLYASL